MPEKLRRALRPDAQAFDKIVISTVPRYKTSEMSGDEWRISAKIEFFRKGRLVHTEGAGNIDYACQLLNSYHIKAIENGAAYYAGEGDLCDQEGCEGPATVTYRLKKEYCRSGHASDTFGPTVRQFCDQHKRRGDCGLEDSDNNYETL